MLIKRVCVCATRLMDQLRVRVRVALDLCLSRHFEQIFLRQKCFLVMSTPADSSALHLRGARRTGMRNVCLAFCINAEKTSLAYKRIIKRNNRNEIQTQESWRISWKAIRLHVFFSSSMWCVHTCLAVYNVDTLNRRSFVEKSQFLRFRQTRREITDVPHKIKSSPCAVMRRWHRRIIIRNHTWDEIWILHYYLYTRLVSYTCARRIFPAVDLFIIRHGNCCHLTTQTCLSIPASLF